jgi:hypothetical protein
VALDGWVTYWKSRFSRLHIPGTSHWQPNSWHTRLRKDESYVEKWNYVRHNPVRHGLVADADQWPYQGELFELRWH